MILSLHLPHPKFSLLFSETGLLLLNWTVIITRRHGEASRPPRPLRGSSKSNFDGSKPINFRNALVTWTLPGVGLPKSVFLYRRAARKRITVNKYLATILRVVMGGRRWRCSGEEAPLTVRTGLFQQQRESQQQLHGRRAVGGRHHGGWKGTPRTKLFRETTT